MTKPYERLSQVYDFYWSDFSRKYVDWINRLLAERGIVRGKILDLACGTGDLAVELAHYDHMVHGIDISDKMIEKARVKSARLSNISFDIQDIVQFKVKEKFDLVACTFDSINYIRRLSQVRRMLFCVASALYETGLFIFDSNTKNLYRSHSNETTKLKLDGQDIIQHCMYDSIRNEAITTFSFPDGTCEIHRQRPYYYDELSPLLISAGLDIVYRASWFDMIPYAPETEKLFCIAEKRMQTTISH
ncbi:class I SAM-dependent DNA methyltransferase [Chloroflexota bacterium]